MSGVFALRKEHSIEIAYDVSADTETGECIQDKYGDGFIKTVKGVL